MYSLFYTNVCWLSWSVWCLAHRFLIFSFILFAVMIEINPGKIRLKLASHCNTTNSLSLPSISHLKLQIISFLSLSVLQKLQPKYRWLIYETAFQLVVISVKLPNLHTLHASPLSMCAFRQSSSLWCTHSITNRYPHFIKYNRYV